MTNYYYNNLFSPFSHLEPQCLAGVRHGISFPTVNPVALATADQPEELTGRFSYIPQEHNYKLDPQYTGYPPVLFFTNGISGFRLSDALKGDFSGLAAPDAQVMDAAAGDKVCYAFEWPTEKTPVRKQMNAHRKHGVQSRSRVAQQVATVVGRFIHDRSGHIPSDPNWRVGPGSIELKHVYLVELKRMSKATWVAKLALCFD